jgi:hypothetical protein
MGFYYLTFQVFFFFPPSTHPLIKK